MKSTVFVFLIFSFFGFSFRSFAQNDPAANFKVKIVPPSPEAASLGRYGEYPVSLNNGLVNISIPLYEIKSGNLTLPISVSYHAGGVRAYDVSSSVGLGWSLNAGGAISRATLGLMDESVNGVLNNPFPEPNGPGEHFSCFLSHISRPVNVFDSQFDLFNYNLGGSSGKFAFKNIKAKGTPREIVTIPYSPVKIEVSSDFQTFTVVDLDGTTYIFGQVERTSVMSDGSLSSDGPTAWYLTSIISADKSDTITITYTQPVQIRSVQASNSLSEREDFIYGSLASRCTYSKSSTSSTHYSISIEEITFNNGKVFFEYASDRLDVDNGKRLNAVKIFQKNNGQYTELKRFNFTQSYFTASAGQKSQIDGLIPAGDVFNKRLRLDSFNEEGFQNAAARIKPPYTFEYEGTGYFPVYGSTAQDFMGFYNGAHSNKHLLFYDMGNDSYGFSISQQFGANREVNPAYLRSGVLKRIIFPTGGYSLFELEPNQVNYDQTVITPTYQAYSYQLTSRDRTRYEEIFTVTPAMTGNASSIRGQLKLDVVNNLAGQPQISTTVSVFDMTANAYADFLVDAIPGRAPAQVGISSSTVTLSKIYELELLADHTYKFTYGSGLPTTENFLYTGISWRIQTGSTTTIVNKTDYTGGLRIKSITSDDGSGNTVKKKYSYTKWYYNSNLFNGSVSQMADLFKARNKRWAKPEGQPMWSKYWYNNYGENITFQLGSSSNTVVAYEEVEEFAVDSQDKPLGKTVTTFNKATDNIPSLAPYFRSDEEWKRSQLANRKIYKTNASGAFVLLKEEINLYDYTVVDAVKSYSANLFDEGNDPETGIVPLKECNINPLDSYKWMDFDQNVYKSNLISTNTIQYDDNGLNPVSTIAEYFYDANKHHQLIRTTTEASDGKKLASNTKYPLDYTIGSCDLSPCFITYNNQINDLLVQKNTCETQYYSQYTAYVNEASAIAAPIYQAYENCYANCNGSSTCQLACFNTRENDLNASQYHETLALANTAFDNYLNCTSVYQSSVTGTVVPQLNTCKTDYNNCVTSILNGSATSKDKSLVIMQRDNVVNRVIENLAGFTSNGVEYITSGSLTDFKPVANGTTVPDIIWGFNSASLTTKTAFDLNPSAYYRKIGSFIKYDDSNNILQKQKDTDVISSYTWDYNKEYPVAEVLNASSDDIAYTSFESDGTGNWSVTGSARNTSESRTGKKSYSLVDGDISKANLVNGKVYKINFWAKNGSVSLNGTVLTPTSSVNINGWQYYESAFTGSATITTAIVSGTALIDELRFYPSGAQMSTFTYDPLTGLTSQTDTNNTTIFNEYDALGRLYLIKDHNGNILKKYSYHYSGE